ncbi:MAG TPA: TetR family transcriptional regulator [Sphingobium sp.]|uniref:TetR/AcrR family transcriptional regulator n=1 Tax=Sphingobium sp. TaxID=1912891 RepID=UPI002ED35A7A
MERENIELAEGRYADGLSELEPVIGNDGGPDRAEAIVNAAFVVLGDFGLEGLTVRAVLKQAGLNRRSFYEHFLGKDDLVLAVFARSVSRAAENCRQQISAMSNPMEQLKAVVLQLAIGDSPFPENQSQSLRRGAALCREHMRLAEARPADLVLALKPLLALFSELLAAGVEQGQVRDYSPQRLAALVYNLMSTSVHAELLAEEAGAGDPARRQALAEEIWEFCRRAIAA